MRKNWYLFFLVMALMITMVHAEPSYIFKQDQAVDFCTQVYNSNLSEATSDTSCYFTLQKPATLELLIDDQNMSFNGTGSFCYAINATHLDTLGEYSINIRCDDTTSFSFSKFSVAVTTTGNIVSLSNIILVLVFLCLCGTFIWIGTSFSNEKFIVRTGFYLFGILMGILSVNSARIITSESTDLNTMANAGFILIIAVLLFMFLYIFIFALINVFKQVKNKREIEWR